MKIKIFKSLPIVAIILSVFITTWTYLKAEDRQIIACVKENGILHIIGTTFRKENCKEKETLLTWNTQGPKGDTGEQGPKGDSGGELKESHLHLFDASNQDLGVIVNKELGPNYFITFLPRDNVFLNFEESNTEINIRSTPNSNIYFLELDCQGTPYGTKASPLNSTFVNGRLFKSIAGNKSEVPNIISILGPNGCENQPWEVGSIYPYIEIDLPFTLPLAWPLQVKYSYGQ